MSFRLILVLASGALLLSSAAALAQTATASTNVNVRSGPGANYEVIDRLPAGEPVNIIDCRGDWCEISMGRDSGFVARGYLDDGGRRSRVRVMEGDDDYDSGQIAIESYDPDATAGLAIGGYYESRPFYIREGYYYWGGRWYARRPGAPGWRDGSWRRFEERRGPGTIRDGRTNKPPRVDDRRARIDRDVRDPRIRPMERRGPDAPNRDGGGRPGVDRSERLGGREGDGSGVDRGGREARPEGRGPSIDQRADQRDGRTGGGTIENRDGGAGQGGMGRTPGGSSDRGDRIGLDKAGPGRNDR